MKLSLNWLSEWVDLPPDVPALCDLLTMAGVEVEGKEERGVRSDKIVVAEIVAAEPHPNADRLTVCRVDCGEGEPRQIVCGAKNFKVGDRVPLALPGAVLPGDFKIKVGKLRGVDSHGMLCSGAELGVPDDADGLLILPPDSPVGERLDELLPPDVILDIEVTPNRPDLLGLAGVAREIAALAGSPLKSRPARAPAQPGDGGVEVSLEAPDLCPFYTARRIDGVQVGPSPAWLAQKLAAAGLRPINNVVDVTNFVLLETGQPLHAFDADKLSGGIRVRRAAEGEMLMALDGKSYVLLGEDAVIAGGSRAVAIAGVMGGEETGVSETTVSVVLESAWFLPSSVRRTSRRLGLTTDSSYRFERRVDPEGVRAASDRAVALILELAGGTAVGAISVAGAPPEKPAPVALRNDRCRAVIGADVGDGEIAGILGRLGLTPAGDGWQVPSFRADLSREIDLIEEVARVIGMERVPPKLSATFVPSSPADCAHDDRMGVRRSLAALGFSEARTLALVGPEAETFSGGIDAESVLRVKNPLGEEHGSLRPSLVPNLLASASRNARAGFRGVRLFEIGRVFLAPGEEPIRLGLVATGPLLAPSWRCAGPAPVDFHDFVGLLTAIGFEGLSVSPSEVPGFALGARVIAGGGAVGWIGQLPPGAAREMDFADPVFAAELDLGSLSLPDTARRAFREIERYPASVRDVAFLAPASVTHAQVMEAIRSAGELLLADAMLFDLFSDPSGEKVPPGQKSLAYSLTYRSPGRTLTSEEVAGAHGKVKQALAERLGVSFRE